MVSIGLTQNLELISLVALYAWSTCTYTASYNKGKILWSHQCMNPVYMGRNSVTLEEVQIVLSPLCCYILHVAGERERTTTVNYT